MKKTNSWNRLLSLVLCICMVLSMVPGYALPALAEEAEPTCSCSVKCTEGSVNSGCPVCSAEGADLSGVCTGTEETTVVATFNIDAAAMTPEELKAAVDAALAAGYTAITVNLAEDADATMFSAITAALATTVDPSLDQYELVMNYSGTIDLTISGAKTVPECTFYVDEYVNENWRAGAALRSVTLTDAITIGESAFAGSSMTSFSAPNVIAIEDYAFTSCMNLTDVYLPSVQTLGGNVFFECYALKTISLPECIDLGNGVFNSCEALETVYAPKATNLGAIEFMLCTSLTKVTLGSVESVNQRYESIDDGLFCLANDTKNIELILDCNQKALSFDSGTKYWTATEEAFAGDNQFIGYTFKSITLAHTPVADDGDCTTAVKCATCGETVVEAKESHTFDETGKCGDCNARAVASLTEGETVTYYTTADGVFAAAKNSTGSATITILADARTTDYVILHDREDLALVVEEGAVLTLGYRLYFRDPISGGGTIAGEGNGEILLYNGGTIDGVTVSTSILNLGGAIIGGTFSQNVEMERGQITGGTFNGTVTNEGGQITGGIFHGAVINDIRHAESEQPSISGGIFNNAVSNKGGLITGGAFNAQLTNTAGLAHDPGVGEDVEVCGKIINTADPTTFTLGEAFVLENIDGTIDCASHIWKDGICRLCSKPCAHTGGTATCTEKAVCDLCGISYGEPAGHSFDETGKCSCCGQQATISVTDGTNTYYALDAVSLNTAVTDLLNTGARTFTVNLPATAEVKLFTAIRRALIDTEGVADGSINLTLAGVTAIPDHDDQSLSTAIFGNIVGTEHESVTQLAAINLPDVLTIGDDVFKGCENLLSLTAPKVQTVGDWAFTFTGITELELPEATTLGWVAFAACENLTSVKLPKAVSLGQQAFDICDSLTKVELTAEGDITFSEYVFENTGNIDLLLNFHKAEEVTNGVTWKGYTFKSITFVHADGTTNHSFTHTPNEDGETYKKICSDCGYVEIAAEAHTGGTATCTEKAVCDICGASYGELDPYNHTDATAVFEWPDSYSDYMEVYADLVCSTCGEEVDYFWVYGDAITVETLPGTDCKNPTVATCTLNYEYNGVTYTDTKTYIVPGDPHAGEIVNGFCSACGGFEEAVWNEEDYVYEIYNAGQLYWYAQELNTNNSEIYVKLMKDIVIPENAPNWEPINASYAYFNGNFHTISGLKCIDTDAQYVGLFGMEGWWYEISNLHIDSSYFEGSGYVGAVVARMTNGGSITNCAVTNTTVQGDGDSVGTLAGYLSVGSVVNCFVDTNTLVGGYTNGYVTIENSYYLSETETEDGGKTAEQFASGEVAYLLQSGIAEEDIYDEDWNWIGSEQPHVWGQTVGQDAYPILKGQKVYENLDCAGAVAGYANESIITEHSFVQGYCQVCGEPLGDAVLDGVTYVFGGVIPLRWYPNHAEVPTYWVAGDGYVYFDPAAKLLTLDNATVYSELWSSEDAAVYWEDDLVINFSGTNTMSANDHNNGIVISVEGATVMNGIGKDAVLNINSGADEAARFGSLTVNSGSVSFVSKDSAHTSVGVSTVALTVAEGAVVNVTAGNANKEYGLSYGMAAEKLHVDGTLNASYGFCVNESDVLSCGVICTELTGSGTINALMLQIDQENMILNFTACGKAVLASNWKAMAEEEVTFITNFTVAEGAILTIPEGVTLDLTGLPAENISIRGTILNNGTIICNHSVAEDDGDCTTDIPCLICHQPVIAGNDEHDWMDATCTTAKVCSFCGTTEGDALGHGTIEGFEYHQYSDYHEVWCTDCWAYSYQENHTYGEDHYCICGAPEMFTVTFMNGDEVWITDNRYYNTKIGFVGMNYPTKEGYSFSGWYTAEGDPIANGTLVMGDMVVYAGFRINTYNYTVEVYTMDLFGNYGEPVVTTEAAAFGSIVDLTGYQTGEHFYLDGENINSKLYATVPANDDLVMRVYVVRKSYDITWILNGCTVVTEIVSDLPTSLRYSGDLGEYGWHYVNMLLDTPAGYRVVDYVDGNGNSIAKESYNGHDRLKFPVTGDMTIEVVLEKETVDDPVKLETAALSFKEKIHYNIFFSLNLAETVELADMGLILFDSLNADGTVDDAIATYSGAVQMDGKYMVATDGIHAKQMGDTIYFRVYAKLADGSYVYSKTVEYSAVTYAQHILKGNYSDSDKALVVAMLNYGAQAQRYFGYNTENPVNAGLTEEQQALVKGYESDLLAPVQKPDSSKTGAFASTGTGFARKAPAVSFEGSFVLNYFFTPSATVAGDMTLYYWTENDYAAATELTAENATGSIVMTPGAQYHAVLEGIHAKDVDSVVYVAAVYSDGTTTHCTGVLPYSIGAYLTSHAARETNFQAMAQAAAVYCSYCKEYFKV